MTRAERAALPFMHPGRVDVIAGGAMVLLAAMRAAQAPRVVVSETDILDGILYRLASLTG
jgi:exopolyphosphatase/guanosine-5'-triphosphate,3'-diphosphate pyrophosphatase